MIKNYFLITSGAYVNDELASDFGLIPNSFLPLGHKRIFEHQLELIKNFNANKYISLPDNYIISERDNYILSSNNINIIKSNPNISLNESILNFIEEKIDDKSSLFILHGDTLFNQIEFESDILFYNTVHMYYRWGYLSDIVGNSPDFDSKIKIVSGYFSFSNIKLLKKIICSSTSFESTLKEYNTKNRFKLIEGEGWLDFGHSNLYYKSKRSLNVTRNFNQTFSRNNHLVKLSSDIHKIKSEFQWFKNIPSELQFFLPHVCDYKSNDREASYLIEFIGAPTLQEKYVFGELPQFTYVKIIDEIFKFIEISKSFRQDILQEEEIKEEFKKLYIYKTKARIREFIDQLDFDSEKDIFINGKKYNPLNKFVGEILLLLNKEIESIPKPFLSIMHGDICFSNILYDSRTDYIKLIDPRGGINIESNKENFIYGDYRYDIAKLGHSIVGSYDFIVTGFYDLKKLNDDYSYKFNVKTNDYDEIKNLFYKKSEAIGISESFLKLAITNLFLSMLPLHAEDKERQIALLLNAYKFYYN